MSPFEVLGVALDVDDTGVKRAYAKKVRQHPPETDPEGFQRVYEAFELLRNADSRARAARQLQRAGPAADAETLARLDEVDTLLEQGELQGAAEVLDSVTRRAPELDTAWESFVTVLERLGGAHAAGPAAVRWARARQTMLEAQLAAARLRTVTFDYDEARAALQVASALAPHDRRVFLARAELARTREDWQAALTEISNALALPAEHVSDARLRCARLRVHIERGDGDAVTAELARIDDAGLLSAMGALAASLRKSELAAEIFGRAKGLEPARRFTLTLPRQVAHSALAARTQEWVKDRLANPPRRDVTFQYLTKKGANPLYLYGVVGGMTALTIGAWLPVVAFLMGIVVLFTFMAAFGKGPVDSFCGFLELRPLHLLHCTANEIRIIPLFRISAMRSQDRTVMLFVDKAPAVTFESPDVSNLFVQQVLAQRDRLQTLAEEDLLDTELDRESLDWG